MSGENGISVKREDEGAPLISLDGQFMREDKHLLDALTPGVLKAKGAFETFVVEGNRCIAFEKHIIRMNRALRRMGIKKTLESKKILGNIGLLMKKNKINNARVRIMVWMQEGKIEEAIMAVKFLENKKRGNIKIKLKAMISAWQRPKTRLSDLKTLEYFCFRQAALEAKQNGCYESILLNSNKEIVEGSRSNIFFVKNKMLHTPAIKCGCLNGITREMVIKLARSKKIKVNVGVFMVKELMTAEEVFLTNSCVGVAPIGAIGGKRIAKGRAGEVTKLLNNAYWDCS